MSSPDTPLFVKTHDFLLWLIRHIQRFPKNLRQSYTLKLELMAFDFQEAILMENAVRGPARSNWLATADGSSCSSSLKFPGFVLHRLGRRLQQSAGTHHKSSMTRRLQAVIRRFDHIDRASETPVPSPRRSPRPMQFGGNQFPAPVRYSGAMNHSTSAA